MLPTRGSDGREGESSQESDEDPKEFLQNVHKNCADGRSHSADAEGNIARGRKNTIGSDRARTLLPQPLQRISAHPHGKPLLHHLGSQRFVELNGWRVPIQHLPLIATATPVPPPL